MAKRTSSKTKTDQALRRRQVAQLRRAGWAHEAIADELGCSVSTVQRDIREMVLTLHAEATADIDAWRSTQLEELQQMRDDLLGRLTREARIVADKDGNEAWREGCEDRDAQAIVGRLVSMQEREAKMMGLDVAQPAVLVPVMSEERAAEIRAELPPRK